MGLTAPFDYSPSFPARGIRQQDIICRWHDQFWAASIVSRLGNRTGNKAGQLGHSVGMIRHYMSKP
jgi:hypothetical protein